MTAAMCCSASFTGTLEMGYILIKKLLARLCGHWLRAGDGKETSALETWTCIFLHDLLFSWSQV